MKIVLWIGNESNQKALANKIHSQFPISGIVTENKKGQSKITISIILEKVIEKLFLSSISEAWWGMKAFYNKQYAKFPETKILAAENINALEVHEFTKEIAPDLIIVSGTRLIKKQLLALKPRLGILNLHTGLSPYIKGGPNCTNWCIATKQYHLIGNTIMFIDEGIDSGNIITTELTEFNGKEKLLDIHIKVMEHAHDLYLKTITHLSKNEKLKSIKQNDIAKGKTYYTKQWGLKQKIQLIDNLKEFKSTINSAKTKQLKATVRTVNLHD